MDLHFEAPPLNPCFECLPGQEVSTKNRPDLSEKKYIYGLVVTRIWSSRECSQREHISDRGQQDSIVSNCEHGWQSRAVTSFGTGLRSEVAVE